MADLEDPPPDESHSGRVLKGFLAMTASSFLVMGIQLVYAAFTSRLLPPSAFGAYAVALSGIGFIGMLGGSSLGQAAARRDHDSVHLDRSLVALSLMVGSATALVAILLAPSWGRLWGLPDSTQVTRVLALGIPLSAIGAVLAGILRRRGQTSAVAGRTALGQLAGLAIGLAAVLATRTAWSLAVATLAGFAFSVVLLASAVPSERLKPTRPTSASIEDALYAVKSAGMNLLRYGTNLIPVWSIGRFAGASALGGYNRATTLMTLPLEATQRSFSYSLFPELRPNGPVSQSNNALTDIIILVTWPAVIVGGLGFFAAPPLLSILLGPGWEEAVAIAGPALLLGVVPMVGVPLASTLEAQGRFRASLVAWLGGAVFLCLGALATLRSQSLEPGVLGLLTASVATAALSGLALLRSGDLSFRSLARGTAQIIALQTAITIPLAAAVTQLSDNQPAQLAAIAVVGGAELAILWLFRGSTHFGRVAKTRQMPGFR